MVPALRYLEQRLLFSKQILAESSLRYPNRSGEYLFAQLPVGAYSISVSATDFKQSTVPRIDVHASNRLRRDFTLELGPKSEIVTVTESAAVQLESAEINDVIGRQQVVDLPVKSRQFLDLAMLSPGAVRPPGGTRGDAMQQAETWLTFSGNAVDTIGI
jgi:hypothetical protein